LYNYLHKPERDKTLGRTSLKLVFREKNIDRMNFFFKIASKGAKGKAISLQAWTGPEGSRRMRLPDFMTISP
jgi:hypothetical protein